MVNMSLTHDGHCLEAPVRVGGKAGNGLPVVHAPAVFVGEIAADLPPGQRGRRAHVCVTGRVVVNVVHAKQKRVDGLPGEGQRCNLENGRGFYGVARLSELDALH